MQNKWNGKESTNRPVEVRVGVRSDIIRLERLP